MGRVMADTLINEIKFHNKRGEPTRAIVPCGPACWYAPFVRRVNRDKVSLKGLFVFHMDECLDWQGRLLPRNHPYNFRTFMEKHFYGGIPERLAVPEEQRFFLTPRDIPFIEKEIARAPVDITLGEGTLNEMCLSGLGIAIKTGL